MFFGFAVAGEAAEGYWQCIPSFYNRVKHAPMTKLEYYRHCGLFFLGVRFFFFHSITEVKNCELRIQGDMQCVGMQTWCPVL